jgi:hypothetical protein
MAAKPGDHQWGSGRYYLKPKGAPDWLAWRDILAEHGKTVRTAAKAYAAFLEEGMTERPRSPLVGAAAGVILGSAGFVEEIRSMLSKERPFKDVPASRGLQRTLRLGDIERCVCQACDVRRESLRLRGRHGNLPRRLALYLARTLTGTSLAELGSHFGGVTGQAVSLEVKRVERQRKADPRLNRRLRRLEARLTRT